MDKAGRVVHKAGGTVLGQHGGGDGLCEVQLQEWDCDSFVKTRQEGSEEWPKWSCSGTSGDFELNVLTFIHLAFFQKDCLDFHEEMERERDVRC